MRHHGLRLTNYLDDKYEAVNLSLHNGGVLFSPDPELQGYVANNPFVEGGGRGTGNLNGRCYEGEHLSAHG